MQNILESDVTCLQGIGEKRAELLRKLDIYTVGDLLRLYPRSYIDLRQKVSFSQALQDGQKHAFSVIALTDPKKSMIRKNLTLFKLRVTDGQSDAEVIIYNDRYTAMKLHRGESYVFYGSVQYKKGIVINSPQIIEKTDSDRIIPVYPQTAGLSSKTIERFIKSALDAGRPYLIDCLPNAIRMKHGLCSYTAALEGIHFPKCMQSVQKAAERLIFEELLIWQLAMRRIKARTRSQTAALCATDYSGELIKQMPFEPTNAQKRAIEEIAEDMASGKCMSRLLQGDVGSGKTAVAAAAAYNAARNGFQTALMAPTELLAQQHYATLEKLLKNTDINIGLLTGSTTAANKRKINEGLKNGDIQIITGTHALISKGVEFANLGLVITDEQHRFGVAQRGELASRGCFAHTLAMSATPIPRTLALTFYGDLDVSVLDELPPGRKKVDTYKIDSSKRMRAFDFIKKHLDEGRQCYIVCALVEENDSGLLAATAYYELLKSKYFCSYRLGLLHGKMKPSEKEQIMSAFAGGEIQLLVSTTVIEVGVDVPNAVIMMVENAERFGLSQLHQLRGRVGRGQHDSYCILVSDSKSEITKKRLAAICKTGNGFEIAETDLKLRGPGDFFGRSQHGFLPFSIADTQRDIDIVRLSQREAEELLENDPQLDGVFVSQLKKQTERIMLKYESA